MKTKLLTLATLALLASSAFAAAPTYLYRLYSPGVKGSAAPVDPFLPTASSVFATWNPVDKGTKMLLSPDNLTAVSNGASGRWPSVRSTQGKAAGKWYWESTITGPHPTNYGYIVGAGTSSFSLDMELGTSGAVGNSFGWYPSAGGYSLNWSGATVAASPSGGYPVGTTFMVAMDMDNHAIYLGVNGTWNGSGDPTSGTAKTGAALSGFTGTVFPAVTSADTQSTANFGATPFKYSVPSGYHAGVFQ